MFAEVTARELQRRDELELDAFDDPDTCYVVSRNADGHLDGHARLLPTTARYSLAECYPGLLNGLAPPRRTDVWELSRFAAADLDGAAASPLNRNPSPVAVGLLRAALEVAAQHGARRVITLSPLAVERLLQRSGCQAYRAGPPAVVDGRTVFACLIPVA